MTASRTALAEAIRRSEWDRVALCLLLGMSIAIRNAPPGTIDDLLALFSDEEITGPPRKEVRRADRPD